jgi:hypothetical protein
MLGSFSIHGSHLTIPGKLPSLNEIIAQATYNRFAYASLKKKMTALCAQWVLAAGVPVFDKPVKISIAYLEPNARRDLDGVYSAGMKFILDALGPSKHGGTERIKNDTREWVREISNSSPAVDKLNPRIEVSITEITTAP